MVFHDGSFSVKKSAYYDQIFIENSDYYK